MRAGHAFAEDAPDSALILLDAPRYNAADAARLLRLVVDAGRYGFRTFHLVHGPAAAPVVAAAVKGLPALSPLPKVDPIASDAPFATLCERLAHFGPRTLVLDGLGLYGWNWLDLMAAVSPARAGVAVLCEAERGEDPAFALREDRAGPALADTPGLAFAGLALLERHALDGLAAMGTLQVALSRLAGKGALGGRLATPLPMGPAPVALRDERPALFLDRDGTLNVDYGYVYDPERLVFLPGAATAVKRANDLGFYVFLVTNQSGVGRGYYSEADVERCNGTLQRHLRAYGAHLDDIRYCSDHPDALLEAYRRPSGWRKPAPGMLIDLMEHWPVTREKSLMIGDKDSDVAAGHAAGVTSLLFSGGDLDAFLAPELHARAERASR